MTEGAKDIITIIFVLGTMGSMLAAIAFSLTTGNARRRAEWDARIDARVEAAAEERLP